MHIGFAATRDRLVPHRQFRRLHAMCLARYRQFLNRLESVCIVPCLTAAFTECDSVAPWLHPFDPFAIPLQCAKPH